MRPRIAWLLDSNGPTGAGRMALRRARELHGWAACQVFALYLGKPAPPRYSSFRLISPINDRDADHALRGAKAIFTTSVRTLEFALSMERRRAPIVHYMHTSDGSALRSDRLLRALPEADRVVVPSHFELGEFATIAGLRQEQLVVDDDYADPADALLSPAVSRVVLYAGRLTRDSGVLELVRGFADALPRMPGWRLHVAGWGARRGAIEEYIETHRLYRSVLLLGPRYDIARLYAGAAAVARLATSDAFGLSVVEAISAGLPVLGAATVPAVRQYVQDGQNGIVMTRTDPESVADALLRLSDTDYRLGLAAGARRVDLASDADRGGLRTRALVSGLRG